MKKICSIILAVVFVISSLGINVFASDYENHWAEDVIYEFIKKGIISGDNYGKVNPDKFIKRSEFVKIVNKYFGYSDKASESFADVSVSAWYADEFLIAKEQGYITGDEYGYANPESYIRRAEVCVILSRLLELPANEEISAPDADAVPLWARSYVGAAVEAGFIKGYADGSLRIENNITRAEAISLISRTGKEETKEEAPSESLGNTAAMTQPSGGSTGGGGGGGGGGSASAPSGTIPAKIDVRSFDSETYVLELTAQYISEFVFTIKAGDREFTYGSSDISPIALSSGYKFEAEDIILKTVKARGINGEKLTVYVKGIAESGKADTGNIEVFSDIVTVALPAPDGLKAAYNIAVGGGYNSDEYLLEWNVLSSATEYKYEVYNSKEEDAAPVLSGTVLKSELAEDAVTVSKAVAIDAAWGDRENLYFTVSAKDGQTEIYSAPSEAESLVLDAPIIEEVVYTGEDKYEIKYTVDSNAVYEIKAAGTALADGKTYTAAAQDGIVEITLKAYCESNETATARLEYNFAFGGGDGVDEPYLIYNERQFINISKFTDKSFKLCEDIALSDGYQPILGFKGTLDGDNHTIRIGNKAQGVFDQVEGNTYFKNLTVEGSVSGEKFAGAFVGAFVESSDVTSVFENCINKANVESSTASHSRAGGFAGSTYSTGLVKFKSCSNYGNIISNAGGNNGAGGFVGLATGVEIIDSANYGNISAQRRAGGIIGYIYLTAKISGSANFGNVSISASGEDFGAGGMAGSFNEKYTASIDISSSLNAGKIAGGVAGGIAGFYADKGMITDSLNVGIAGSPFIATGGSASSIGGCYFLEGSAADALGATEKTKNQLKTENLLSDFEIKQGFEYPIPKNINYVSKEEMFSVKISDAQEFSDIRNNLNGIYILTGDIDLTEISYTAITGFSGVLDGGGYTVTIGTDSAPAAQGLFETLQSGAVIKNLTVDGNIKGSATNQDANIGAFAGNVTSGATVEFINCVNKANVASGANKQRIGGIVGSAYGDNTNTSFEGCVNYGSVTSGWGQSAAGGIVGLVTNPTIISCVNYGVITGVYRAGGMIGWSYGAMNVSGCANFGAVSAASATTVAGGIAGDLHAATTGAITGCYNSGAAAAGMVGTLNGAAVSSCVNTGTVTNAIANTNTADNYYLEGSAVNANGASVKTSAELKALGLNGFELKDGYEYPLPAGISYNPPASGN